MDENKISFRNAMRLQRLKHRALKAGNSVLLFRIKRIYPFLFTKDFKASLHQMKICINYLYDMQGKDFRNLIEE